MEQKNPNHLFDCWTRKRRTWVNHKIVYVYCMLLVGSVCAGNIGLIRGLEQSVHAQSWDEMNPAAQSVAAAINQTRSESGLQPLALQSVLIQAGQSHAIDMATNYNYSHYGSDGSSVNDRVYRLGYSTDGWASENWVAVFDPAQAIQWWMNSSVHRGNILNPNWHGLGVGSAIDGSGQIIFVAVFGTTTRGEPVVQAAAPPAEEVAAAPVVEQPAIVEQPAVTQAPADPAGWYTIRPGDTLLSIAIQHNAAWETVAQLNGFNESSLLQIGQQIRVPTAETINPTPATDAPRYSASSETYIVQAGETLFSIGGKLSVSWEAMAAVNGLHENSTLQIDQVLYLPESAATQSAATENASTENASTENAPTQSAPENTSVQSAPSTTADAGLPQVHTVADNETIITIAVKYGLSDWKALLALNGLDENSLLQPGQQIRLR